MSESHERAEGLAAAARVLRERLLSSAEMILDTVHVEVVHGPVPAVMQADLPVSAGVLTLTEVVVTQCAVAVDDARGWSCVMGYDRQGALAAAILDAIASREVDALAAEACELERASWNAAVVGAATTRVLVR